MIQELEQKIAALDQERAALEGREDGAAVLRRSQLLRDRAELLEACRDCAPADPARRKPDAPKDQLGGGTAVLFFASRDGEDPSLRMTASSMRFTPPERVTWRIHFHIVSRGEVTVELPGE